MNNDKITHDFLVNNGFYNEGMCYHFVLAEYDTYMRYLVYHTNGNLLVMEKKFHSSPTVKIKNVNTKSEILDIKFILSSDEIKEKTGTENLYREVFKI